MCFRDTAEQAGEAPVAVSKFQLFEEARHSLLGHSDAVATGRLCQCAAEPSLADPTGAGDSQVRLVGDPSSGEQALEQGLVEAAARAAIHIFWAAHTWCRLAERIRASDRFVSRLATSRSTSKPSHSA